jgi:hypothetical protein
MKSIMFALTLSFGLTAPALAVPPCWPSQPVTVASNQYLTSTQLLAWWQSHTIPTSVSNPHWYVAYHATDEYCKVHYGSSSWAVITGPSQLTNYVNGTIWGGATFNCRRCKKSADPMPAPIELTRD